MPSRYPAAQPASSPAPAQTSTPASHGTATSSFGSRAALAQPAKEPTPARAEAKPAETPAPADIVKAAISDPSAMTAGGAPSEALVDAMLEMVTKEPSSLSVFTSGMAFIKGVSEKGVGVEKSIAAHKKGQSTLPPVEAADDGVPELDGAAAELLRPMLRQWLAENMPRIVEAALRSEITKGGKGPGKA
jgi:cell pole-organizing protein PopZ